MKTGKSLNELAAEITRQAESKKDFIAPVSKLSAIAAPTGQVQLIVGNTPHELGTVAHRQLGEFAGIPAVYYDRMKAEAPELLATNVNRWFADKASEKRMVRTLDGRARAVLSDKFRPLDNHDLAEAVLPILLDGNFIVMSAEITERRMYIKAVDSRITRDVPTGRKMGDGSHVFFDTVSPAITISNSEVGHGALSIETAIYTKACTNLAMIGNTLRKFHTGGRAELSDEVYALLTDQTKRVSDAAVYGQVTDLVRAAFDEVRFGALADKLAIASTDRIEADPVEVIEIIGKKHGLLEGERKGVLARLIEGGDLTRYGLHSAITRHSADILDYDRATELERLGGSIIELSRNSWREVLEAA